jgi:hypothetical protein
VRHLVVLSLVIFTALAPAYAAAPSLQGQWRGSGVVTHRKAKDTVRCRVSFQRLSATAFSVSSQCATENGRYDVTGRVAASGSNRYSGPVQGQGVSGTAVIVVQGNRMSVTVTSRRGAATLSLSRL